MRITLEDLRLYFNDRRGEAATAAGVFGLFGVLMLLARLTGNDVLALMAFVNFSFLWVPLGSLWQKRRVRERWRELGLDSELLRHCEAVAKVDWSLDEHVDAVLSVYTTIHDLSRHNAWFQYPGAVRQHFGAVREGLLAFFQRAQKVNELRRLYDRCAESLRRPARLAALQARVDREYKRLEEFADAFERALLDFSEAMAAAMGSGDEELMGAQLEEFASHMRRLTQSIDEAGSAEGLFAEELDPDVAFDRLMAEEDALALDDEEETPQRMSGGDTADQEQSVDTRRGPELPL